MAVIRKILSRSIKIVMLLLLLACCWMAWYAWYESTPVLQPIVPQASGDLANTGVKTDFFEFTGADGFPLRACLVTRNEGGELSPRQSMVRDLLKVRGKLPDLDRQAEVVLVATSWDKGIDNSMPIAEVLAGAGYRCVLWDSRGVDDVREYCTHGYRESDDVPLLIDAVQTRIGKSESIAALGKGFGASMLMLATPKDERIRSFIGIDNYCILRASLFDLLKEEEGKFRAYPSLWLIDLGMNMRAGYSSFDVVPIDAARQISVPSMLVYADQYAFASLQDAVKIYDALGVPDDKKTLYAKLEEGEPYGTTKRQFTIVHELKNGDLREQHFTLNVYAVDDELMASIAEWIPDNTMPPLPKVLIREGAGSPSGQSIP